MRPTVLHPATEHPQHLRHQRQGQRGGDPEADEFGAMNSELPAQLLARTVVGDACREAGFLDCLHPAALHRRRAGHEADTRRLGRQVPRRLDARRSGSAPSMRMAQQRKVMPPIASSTDCAGTESRPADRRDHLRGVVSSDRKQHLCALGSEIDAGNPRAGG